MKPFLVLFLLLFFFLSIFNAGFLKLSAENQVHVCFLSVECQLPAFGILRTPVNATYRLLNRTDSIQVGRIFAHA
jgi:hypothetical protein